MQNKKTHLKKENEFCFSHELHAVRQVSMEIPSFLSWIEMYSRNYNKKNAEKRCLKKNKTHRFEIDGLCCYLTIFKLEKDVPLEMERKYTPLDKVSGSCSF